jgi:hypothetical protein
MLSLSTHGVVLFNLLLTRNRGRPHAGERVGPTRIQRRVTAAQPSRNLWPLLRHE